MAYEIFVGWRYLYTRRQSVGVWIALAISLLVCALGVVLFASGVAEAAGAVVMFVGALGAVVSALLLVFSSFTAISMMGLAIGVCILVWVLSITSGFQQEFRRKVLGVNAHLLVLKYGIDFADYRRVMSEAEAMPEVLSAAPFIFNEMMLARGNRLSGVLVKGVDPKLVGKVLDLPRHIVEPKDVGVQKLSELLQASKDAKGKSTGRPPGVIIGRELANKLDVKVGDPVRLISPLSGLDTAGWSAKGELPRSHDFRVTGIFFSGFDEYDKRLVYLHLREGQSFFDQGDVVTGVEMKVADVFRARIIAKDLSKRLGGTPYRTVDWSELNHNLFTALAWQKLILQGVIGAIVLVAAFNVLAALAVLVLRKRREISILKSLGMSAGGVARIFQSAGLAVWLVGTSIGLAFGYGGCVVLRGYGFPLDPKVYLISELPVQMNPWEFLFTAIFALVVCALATLYPAIKAAGLDPVQGLRHQ
ncbi:MAG: ABC transporter permease [Deltaproteobacteria bacterium]|nr:ABC transporter permease [Deltaproteobacteria bacterium]